MRPSATGYPATILISKAHRLGIKTTVTAHKPHVLLVITKGEIGGAQSHVIELCRVLRASVQFAAAIGGKRDSHLERALQPLGVATMAMPELRNSLNPLRALSAVVRLRKIVRRELPDVIHAHSALAGVVARLAGRITRVPVVYTVHGFGFKSPSPLLTRLSAWLTETVLAAWTARLICVSEHERTLSARLPIRPQSVSVIPNSVADVAWRSEQAVQQISLVMVARMAKPKRQDLLLHALALLAQRGLHPATLLLGDGPLRREHQALADRLGLIGVRFGGNVENVPEQLAQHQIFMLLSDHEGLPIALLEAMRGGLAIIATRLPGVEELLSHEVSALLVDNNSADISEALQRMLQDAPLRQRLANGARERYESRYRSETTHHDLLEIYGSVLRK